MACEASDQNDPHASSRNDLKIAMPVARVQVIVQCCNIKIGKIRDYWTRDYVFHGNWS